MVDDLKNNWIGSVFFCLDFSSLIFAVAIFMGFLIGEIDMGGFVMVFSVCIRVFYHTWQLES